MPSGRRREFDEDEALDRAMQVFWRRGYEGATLPELTRAMGINRPSLYAAFGNKEELFRRTLARYRAGPSAFVAEALQQPSARSVAEGLLRGAVEALANRDNPRGCMVVQGALVCGETAEPLRRDLAALRESIVAAIRARFERAIAEGDLPAETDVAALARYLATVMHGLAVQAAGGTCAADLSSVVDLALRAWPGGPA
jgi:AcrR family transcriptional regulator